MKGLYEAEKFYKEAVAPMIAEQFAEAEGRIAVGLAGHGSECFGFDDDISRDHDFETGLCLWLTDEDEQKIGFALTRAYDKVKREYGGAALNHMSVGGSNSQGVQTIGSFFRRYTGRDGAPQSDLEWLYIDSAYLAEATNGRVFRDDLGAFSAVRNQVLCGMPEDVLLKKLAANVVRMAQFGQYNYFRCLAHNEEGAAVLALAQFVEAAGQTVFLLNGAHAPYFKWLLRSMRSLDVLGELADPLEFLLTSDNDEDGKQTKKALIEDIAHSVAAELEKRWAPGIEDNYLEPYAYALQRRIKSAQLRNMHILVG